MGQFDTLREKSLGPCYVRTYSQHHGADYNLACLSRVGFRMSKSLYERFCDPLAGAIDYVWHSPRCEVFCDQTELGLKNWFAAGGRSVETGDTDALARRTVGPGYNTDSTTTAPAEWHIVRLSAAAGPWTFTVYAENIDLLDSATDWSVYVAAYTNGDSDVSVMPTPTTGGSVALSDRRMGAFTFTDIADADITQWTYDSSDEAFTINGKLPIVESDVKHGDTVCLIGLTYIYNHVADTSGTEIAYANRQIVSFTLDDVEPFPIKLVHPMQKNTKRKFLVMTFWKCVYDETISWSADTQALRDIGLSCGFKVLNDAQNHSHSPFFDLELIDAAEDVDLDYII